MSWQEPSVPYVDHFFAPPIIGPFVEPTGRASDEHIGARITWTAEGNAYSLDLVKSPHCSFWQDTLVFEQLRYLDFDDFCLDCFEHSSRLREFLNELAPFFRPSSGAPTNAPAGEWLHPKLVAHDFTLGIAKFRGTCLRIPVVWVFGGNAGVCKSRTVYSKVGYIDWTPSETSLHLINEWGTAAEALQRLCERLTATIKEPLLTPKGVTRMEALYQRGLQLVKPHAPKPVITRDDKSIVATLRKDLRSVRDNLTDLQIQGLQQLSDKAYTGLLRTCVTQNNEDATCTFLRHRPLPEYGRQNLVEGFIAQAWKEIWERCAKEFAVVFDQNTSWRYNELIYRAMQMGDADLIQAILHALPKITEPVVSFALQEAYEAGREDLAEIIMRAPIAKPFVDRALMECFEYSLHGYCRQPNLSLYLLENKGVRPLRGIELDEILGLRTYLFEPRNLPILRRACELDPPTQSSISNLIASNRYVICHERTPTSDYLLGLSQKLPGHTERLTTIGTDATLYFIRNGEPSTLELIHQTLLEGATLTEIPVEKFKEWRITSGHDWKEHQGNWIDLMAQLTRWGFPAEAKSLRQLKWPSNKDVTDEM